MSKFNPKDALFEQGRSLMAAYREAPLSVLRTDMDGTEYVKLSLRLSGQTGVVTIHVAVIHAFLIFVLQDIGGFPWLNPYASDRRLAHTMRCISALITGNGRLRVRYAGHRPYLWIIETLYGHALVTSWGVSLKPFASRSDRIYSVRPNQAGREAA